MRTMTRRGAIAGAVTMAAGAAVAQETATLPFGNGTRPIVTYPQKRPLLRLTARPPQLETPFAMFDEGAITANDAFFVRYHLADIPFDKLDAATWRLRVGGTVAHPASLSLEDLKALPSREIVAVNQCSGNGRGFFEPRVAGGQAGNGLMGCARWTGVALKTVLERAGIGAGAVEVRFDGADGPVFPETPDFVKALPLSVAMNGDVMLAWAMNGTALPRLNGFPLRLVVPGYYGTYWMKHLTDVTVVDRPVESFWMQTAYRIPDNDCACVEPGKAPAKTRPIGRMNVRSFITNVADGARVKPGTLELRGIAFDGGAGIALVRVSADGGGHWEDAVLGADLGGYAFRTWSARVNLAGGPAVLMVQAVGRDGETQPAAPRWNPSGYMRNVIESVKVVAA